VVRLTLNTASLTSTLPIVHPLGAVGTPSITFVGDLNTGIYSSGADTLNFATAGVLRLTITSAGAITFAGALSGATTLSMSGQLTNTLAIGTAPFVITSTTRVANLNVATAGTADTFTSARNINGVSFNGSADISIPRLTRIDDRAIAPADGTANTATFFFTSWANDNTGPYADAFLLRGYSDASGGLDNLVTFRKDAIGMRIWQQTYGSATAFASYREVAFINAAQTFTEAQTFSSSILLAAGSAGTPSLSFSGDTNTGLYSVSGDSIGVSTGGTLRMTVGTGVGVGMAASGTAGRIDASNDIVAYSSSDLRFKENIKPIESSLNKVMSIRGVTFDWVLNPEHHGNAGHDYGVIAQEIEALFPEMVRTRDSGYKAVRYEKLIPVLIEAIKELKSELEELKVKNGN
jgi:hypothetical protein